MNAEFYKRTIFASHSRPLVVARHRIGRSAWSPGLLALACHVSDVTSGTVSADSTTSSQTTSGVSADSGTTSASSTSADSSGDAGETTAGSTGGLAESCQAIDSRGTCVPFAPPSESYSTQPIIWIGLTSTDVCPCASTMESAVGSISAYIEAPEGWPTLPHTAPAVVFHHGAGQLAESYDFSGLAASGFVVINVETGVSSGSAADFGLLCGIELAQSTFEVVEGTAFRDAVDCNLLVAAHSNGAGPAGNILADTEPSGVMEAILRPYALRGGMLLAPELNTDGADLVGGPLPILILASAADVDIDEGRDPIARYDLAALESAFDATEVPRAMVYSWGTDHRAFGGGTSIAPDTGRALVSGYLPAFAAATVFGDATSRATWWSYITREAYPTPVLDPAIWDHVDPFALQSPVHCDELALGDCTTTAGCEVVSSACVQVDCGTVATNACADTPGCVLSAADVCMHLPRLRTAYTVDQAGVGARRQLAFFEEAPMLELVPDSPADMNVTVDDAVDAIASIAFEDDGAVTGHVTGLLLAQWGNLGAPEENVPDGAGSIYIELPPGLDLREYSHLSLRVGNVLDVDYATCTVASGGDAAVSFELAMVQRIVGEDLAVSAATSTGRIVQNDYADPTTCVGQQTMTTVRFPLAPFCQGLGATQASHLVLRLRDPLDTSAAARVLIDTIELTASPFDDNAVCGTLAAAWNCEIDELTVTETACSDEPIVTGGTATCDPGDITTTVLDAPLVSPDGESPYHGWYVQTPPGAIVDPEDPSAEELAHVRARCVSACELEYAHDPDVAANCTAPDAFLEPTFAAFDARASHHRFPAAEVQGGGLFEGESLDCDLRTDCCEVFDENLFSNRPARVTDARQGLGRGEEWLYGTDGIITLDGDLATAPVQGTLSGSLGRLALPGRQRHRALPHVHRFGDRGTRRTGHTHPRLQRAERRMRARGARPFARTNRLRHHVA